MPKFGIISPDRHFGCKRQRHSTFLQAALQAGMSMQSQAEVGSALQVFHNLRELQLVRACQNSKPAFGGMRIVCHILTWPGLIISHV